jgi:hypothetical protein
MCSENWLGIQTKTREWELDDVSPSSAEMRLTSFWMDPPSTLDILYSVATGLQKTL